MSKLLMFDFRCEGCGTFEGMVKPDIKTAPCPQCSESAKRLVATPRLDPRMGVDPDFPTAYARWGEARNRRAKIDREHHREHGTDTTPGADIAG